VEQPPHFATTRDTCYGEPWASNRSGAPRWVAGRADFGPWSPHWHHPSGQGRSLVFLTPPGVYSGFSVPLVLETFLPLFFPQATATTMSLRLTRYIDAAATTDTNPAASTSSASPQLASEGSAAAGSDTTTTATDGAAIAAAPGSCDQLIPAVTVNLGMEYCTALFTGVLAAENRKPGSGTERNMIPDALKGHHAKVDRKHLLPGESQPRKN
jgi:hypothetical protein